MTVDRSCEYCAKRFTVSRADRVFCSTRCRVRYHRETALTCYYCGILADSKDHVFPVIYGGIETVNACRECNGTLNCHEPLSHINRVELLIARTIRRYKLNKPIPEWSDDELNELGTSLSAAVRGKIYQRQWATQRVLHMQGRLYKLKCE